MARKKSSPGWMDECKSRFKDCLQQSKLNGLSFLTQYSNNHTTGEMKITLFSLTPPVDGSKKADTKKQTNPIAEKIFEASKQKQITSKRLRN